MSTLYQGMHRPAAPGVPLDLRHRWSWRRRLAAVGAAVLVGGAALVFGISALLAWRITHPTQTASTPEILIAAHGWERLDFRSRSGLRLAGWFGAADDAGGTVIVAHGAGGTQRDVAQKAEVLRLGGVNVFVFEFHGHGDSAPGVFGMGANEVGDLIGAVDAVTRLPGVDPAKIGVIGDSMGGAVAIMAAARDPRIAAVVADSAYARLATAVGNSFGDVVGFPSFPFAGPVLLFGQLFAGVDAGAVNPVEDISRLGTRPVFIIQGLEDRQLSPQNAVELYAAAPGPRILWQPMGVRHTAAFFRRPLEYRARVLAFFGQAFGRLAAVDVDI